MYLYYAGVKNDSELGLYFVLRRGEKCTIFFAEMLRSNVAEMRSNGRKPLETLAEQDLRSKIAEQRFTSPQDPL